MKCKTMSNVIHKPVPSKFSCPVAINRPGILIPNGPPRYRPPPQPQQTKQSYVVEQDEKRTDVTSEQLNAFTTATDVTNRIPRSDTSSNTGSDILHQLQHTIAQSNTTIDTQNMLKFVRKPDVDSVRNANGQVRRMAIEIRNLKEANQRLSDDNQELRDLCCFLDDDRQKGRKLAREWQRFGRYTASVMRQEVSAYQAKLRELDIKQHELIKDNLELKELCLYLDEERNGVCRSCGAGLRRDDGDGSSSSTNADDISHISAVPTSAPQPPNMEQQLPSHRAYSASNDNTDTNTAEYIRRLEMKIKQLENEKQILLTNMKLEQRSLSPTAHSRWKLNDADYVSRPEAVVQALQVLEVREQLEGTNRGLEGELNNQDMDEGERALLREMCNVVWRKLEEASQQNGKR